MPEPFGSVLRTYYESLERYRLLTYGQQVVRAVRELSGPIWQPRYMLDSATSSWTSTKT